jgi:hypothetical protein
MSYKCILCGNEHDEDLFDVSSTKPDVYFAIPESERESRIHLTDDTCVVDHGLFLIRGIIEIPIIDTEATFAFGMWATQSWDHFDAYQSFPESSNIGPFPGQLEGYLRCYEPHQTRGLRVTVIFPGGGLRPKFILVDPDHPLAQDQRNGISIERALWIQHQYSDPPTNDV